MSDPDGAGDPSALDGAPTVDPAPAAPSDQTSPRAGVGAGQVVMIALLSGLVGLVLGFGLAGARDVDAGPQADRGAGRAADPDDPARGEGDRARERDAHRWAPPPWAGREGGPRRSEWLDPDELRAWWDDNVDLDEWRRFFEEEVRPELRRRAGPHGSRPASPEGGD